MAWKRSRVRVPVSPPIKQRIVVLSDVTEFSVIFCVDDDTAQAVESMRTQLPKTPFRDDPPHVTLLRSVTTPELLSDEEAVSFMNPFLDKPNFSMDIAFEKVIDLGSPKYGTTTVLAYNPDPKLIAYRKKLIDTLQSHSCIIPDDVVNQYTPHMTLVLGKTISDEMKQKATELFSNLPATYFSHWKLLRYDESDNTKVRVLNGGSL